MVSSAIGGQHYLQGLRRCKRLARPFSVHKISHCHKPVACIAFWIVFFPCQVLCGVQKSFAAEPPAPPSSSRRSGRKSSTSRKASASSTESQACSQRGPDGQCVARRLSDSGVLARTSPPEDAFGNSMPVAPPGHPDAPPDEIKPYANQNGGVDTDEKPPPRLYLYGPAASPMGRSFIIDGSAYNEAPDGGVVRRSIADKSLTALNKHGFVIVEGIMPAEEQKALEAAAIRLERNMPKGTFTSPLRANRSQFHVPFEEPWTADWLVGNDLVLRLAAGYLTNNMACGRNEKEQQAHWVEWVTEGSKLDYFKNIPPKPGKIADTPPRGCTVVGNAKSLGAWFGRAQVTKTPGPSPLMTRHRDIILPGPGAQLTVGVPLTPLLANNGPLALRPASHVMDTPGYEVIANSPPGSIFAYDSFIDHRALENHLPKDRYVLYIEFEVRGVFTGYVEDHFGETTKAWDADFRSSIDPILRQYVEEAQGLTPGADRTYGRMIADDAISEPTGSAVPKSKRNNRKAEEAPQPQATMSLDPPKGNWRNSRSAMHESESPPRQTTQRPSEQLRQAPQEEEEEVWENAVPDDEAEDEEGYMEDEQPARRLAAELSQAEPAEPRRTQKLREF